jgi:beta-glucosidase
MRDFPEDFLFGSSTAAHQVEGGNVGNDWWAWEHAGSSPAVESSGDGIDQFHRYGEDFALLASLGQQAHRISLEWWRIEPEPGEWSRSALEHYRRVLGALAEHGLTAFVTLNHFTLPRWIAERGSWLAHDIVERFERYCERVAQHLGDLIPNACTINEPQIVAFFGYMKADFPPGRANALEWGRVTERMIAAHEAAVRALKAGPGEPLAGICLQMPHYEPARDEPACVEACRALRRRMTDVYLDDLAGDYLGIQYYSRMRVDPAAPGGFAPPPEGAALTQMGWEIFPEGLYRALADGTAAGLPIVVTENGIATDDDAQRIAYLRDHLAQVKRALDDGIDVRGYLCWSAFDNFEWNEGYRPKFGLIGVDRENGFERHVKPSARAFGNLARSGRLDALSEGLRG